mgnify:CR=1 FL=1
MWDTQIDKEFKTLFLDNIRMKLKSGKDKRDFLLNVYEDCIEISFKESNNADPLSINIMLRDDQIVISREEKKFVEIIYTQKEKKSEN